MMLSFSLADGGMKTELISAYPKTDPALFLKSEISRLPFGGTVFMTNEDRVTALALSFAFCMV